MGKLDEMGRSIAGLLGYSPGPGIYSRLERAVEQMPANVRVDELPGLLKRYKDGVPGWELKETDFPGLVGDAKVIPRQDLLDRVRERSPVFTHREIVLGGDPPGRSGLFRDTSAGGLVRFLPSVSDGPSVLGGGGYHGKPQYQDYGHGGSGYGEILLTQPGAVGSNFGSHWSGSGGGYGTEAVAHARYDTHGDALRINELQSDLGIHNRKMREQYPSASTGDPDELQLVAGPGYRGDSTGPLPFPLEDAWSDLLIKRLALEAARKGHRAIEIASPRAIADKVGGNIENYEHFYGKVVPGAIERLGRKMGGLDEVAVAPGSGGSHWADTASRLNEEIHQYITAAPRQRTWFGSNESANQYRRLVDAVEAGPVVGGETMVREQADKLYRSLMRNEGLQSGEAAEEMYKIMSLAERHAQAQAAFRIAHHRGVQIGSAKTQPPGRRYIMSDEMRRRILTQGIGASLLAPVALDGEVAPE